MYADPTHSKSNLGEAVPMVRGYWLALSVEFIRHHYETAARERIEGAFSAPLRKALSELGFGGWAPRQHQVDVFRAIADRAGSDDEALARLSACGEFVAHRARDEISRLLFGILTPELLLRRLPGFWERDHRGGSCRVDLTLATRRAVVQLADVAGYDHVGVVWMGWTRAALASVGATEAVAAVEGWSRSAPGPGSVRYEVTWS